MTVQPQSPVSLAKADRVENFAQRFTAMQFRRYRFKAAARASACTVSLRKSA